MYDEEVSASVDTTQRVARAQARWTLVFVLGNLKDKKATAVLERIVATPLPDPAVEDGEVFAGEYRIRLRAIDGLRDVGAVDTLEQIHAQGRLLSGAAGVALFELGRAPKGVAPVDLRHLMSQADPTDVNPKQNPQPTMQIPQR